MNENVKWSLIVLAIIGAGYYATKRNIPHIQNQDELEATAPAPFSTEGGAADNLTPNDYQTEGTPVLTQPYASDPSASFLPLFGQWNTPNNPAGNGDNYPSQKGPQPMKLGTANIKNFPDMSPAKVRADARKIGSLTGIWGGQEIQPNEDGTVILDGLGPHWRMLFPERETPIFCRSDKWEPFDQYQIYLDRDSMPTTSKESAITSAAFQSIDRPHLPPFAVVNCHLMAGAYNSIKRVPERQKYWKREFAKLRMVINYHHSKGRTVFFLGDTNNPTCPVPIRGGRWIHNSGMDKIGILPNRKSVFIKGFNGNPSGEIHALNSDHALKIINVKLAQR